MRDDDYNSKSASAAAVDHATLTTMRINASLSVAVYEELVGLECDATMAYDANLNQTYRKLPHSNAKHQFSRCIHHTNDVMDGHPSEALVLATDDVKQQTRVVCDNIRVDKQNKIVSTYPHMIVETPTPCSPLPPSHYVYTLHALVGEGRYGFVFRATRASDGSEWAIKIQPQKAIARSAGEESVRDELADRALEFLPLQYVIQALTSCGEWKCPTVLPIHCATLRCDGSSVYRMPLAKTDLNRFVHTTPKRSPALIRTIMKQLTTAVRDLHARSVAHLDIKPENVMLNVTPNKPDAPAVFLGDLSSSHLFGNIPGGRQFEETDRVCTASSRAPEIFGALGRFNQSADMWSLGCVLYYLVCGQRPFGNDSIQEVSSPTANASVPGAAADPKMDQKVGSTVSATNVKSTVAIVSADATVSEEDTFDRQALLSIYAEFHDASSDAEGVWREIFDDGKTKGDRRPNRPILAKSAPVFGSKRTLFASYAGDPNATDLLRQLLTLDHTKRISAPLALKHPYFSV